MYFITTKAPHLYHTGENTVSIGDKNRQLAAQNLTRISVSDAEMPKTELWGDSAGHGLEQHPAIDTASKKGGGGVNLRVQIFCEVGKH